MGGSCVFSVCSSLVKIEPTRLMLVRSLPKKINNKQRNKKRLARELSFSRSKTKQKIAYIVCIYNTLRELAFESLQVEMFAHFCLFLFVCCCLFVCLQDMFLRFHSPFSSLFRNRIFPIRPIDGLSILLLYAIPLPLCKQRIISFLMCCLLYTSPSPRDFG